MTATEAVHGELKLGGLLRKFIVLLPRNRPPNGLVVVLHGYDRGNTEARGQQMREWTTFDRQADVWGLAVAFADGHGGSWADGRGVTKADEENVDDVEFLRAVIDWTADRYHTFPDRAAVAGISNGGFMAQRMAMKASDQVAVVASVAGQMPATFLETVPSHAVSAILIHGTADSIVSIAGGYSRIQGPDGELRGRALSLNQSAERWREIDRCQSGLVESDVTESSIRLSSAAGVGGTRVVEWSVIGGGHSWPGMPVSPEFTEPVSLEFDAAEEICRFASPLLFGSHVRRL